MAPKTYFFVSFGQQNTLLIILPFNYDTMAVDDCPNLAKIAKSRKSNENE